MRWYLQFRLSYADVAELVTERGVRVDEFRLEPGVRPAPRRGGAQLPACGRHMAIDGHGQVVDFYVSLERAAKDVVTSLRRAIEATSVVPDTVTTDCAAAYPLTLTAILPEVMHETGKAVQQRVDLGHQHLEGRLRGMRGLKTLARARLIYWGAQSACGPLRVRTDHGGGPVPAWPARTERLGHAGRRPTCIRNATDNHGRPWPT